MQMMSNIRPSLLCLVAMVGCDCICRGLSLVAGANRLFRFLLLAGFGAFMFFVAFSVFLTAAIYISPMFCGSNTEKKMVSKPQEIDAGMLQLPS